MKIVLITLPDSTKIIKKCNTTVDVEDYIRPMPPNLYGYIEIFEVARALEVGAVTDTTFELREKS